MRIKTAVLCGCVLSLALSVAVAGVRPGTSSGRARSDGPVHDSRLVKLDDCQSLMDHASEVLLETLIGHLYSQGWWRVPWSDMEGGGPSDFTTTNTQEEGIDELDIVKTNGAFIYTVTDHELLVVDSWPVESSELIARTALRGHGEGLLLHEDTLVVFSSIWKENSGFPRSWSGCRMEFFDLSDPARLVSTRAVEIEGYLTDARLIDGRVFAVISADVQIPTEAWELIWDDELGLPEIDWDASDEEREAAAADARVILEPYVDRIVAKMTPEDVTPLMRWQTGSSSFSEPQALLECSDLYTSRVASSFSVLATVSVDLNSTRASQTIESTGLFADGWIVYASARTLYVAQSSWMWWRGWGGFDMSTDIHAFDISGSEGTTVRYVASGEVPGWMQNQFAMSEYDGSLRTATTLDDWWWGFTTDQPEQGSVISVLRDNHAGELETVGELRGIAPGEQIYASRMMGERGYIVTFERVDPLFTLDLSDPRRPRIVGELKIPGFSSYLHPVGDDHLLSVGMAGEEDGTITGLSVNLFDVSSIDSPELLHSYVFEDSDEAWSWSEALSDHHAVTFHRNVLSIPAYLYQEQSLFSGLMVLEVDVEGGFRELGWVDHSDLPADPESWSPRLANMRRSIYIEDNLFSLSDRGLKVNLLHDPDSLVATVPFYGLNLD